jgi:hypothetical protein
MEIAYSIVARPGKGVQRSVILSLKKKDSE